MGENPQSECSQLNLFIYPTEPSYLSWIVEQPLFSGFVLIGRHCLGHLMANRGAHGVQNPVQPDLHLTQKTQKPKEIPLNTN